MIANTHYSDTAAFAKEAEHIFSNGWQFVALRHELSKNRDFVRVDLPGDSIVVQNFQGELRAFKNVCTHRLNIIQAGERGNRPLICAYHGWTFDAEGMPLGQKLQRDFLAEGETANRLCLTRYRVESCGHFIFISRDPNASPLVEFLGEFASLLEDLSRYIGAETYFGTITHAANWKLLVENVLECYHCATVHRETFVAGLGVGREPISDVRILGKHSSSHFPRVPTKREGLRRKIMAHLDHREFSHNSFFHVHIFPNLFISSTEGTAFYVGHALPMGSSQTALRIRFLEPNVTLTDNQRARQDAINQQGIALGLAVIEEDRAILEGVQRGTALADRPPVLGPEEVRIKAFQNGYRELLNERPEAPL